MARAVLLICSLIALTAGPTPAAAGDPAPTELDKREAAARSRARFFAKIAVKRDYSGEWVIARTARTTAFLDIVDPRHPRSRAKEGSDTDAIHILVVPNQAREHIGEKLGSPVTEADLKVALGVFADAKKLARRLHIKKPRIYANSESRVGVGYFHVHIEGPLPAKKKLPRLSK